MSKKIISLILATLFTAAYAVAQTDRDLYFDEDSIEVNPDRQYISGFVKGGPNLSAFFISVRPTLSEPWSSTPLPGCDLGGGIEYHISHHWSLQLSTTIEIERNKLLGTTEQATLNSFGIDIALPVVYYHHLKQSKLLFGLAPYSRFMLASWITGNNGFINPYTRVVSTDPRTGEPRFAINDFNSGIELSVTWMANNGYFIQFAYKSGLTNMFNFSDDSSYMLPYKFNLLFGYSF